jgi:hypothetical protein
VIEKINNGLKQFIEARSEMGDIFSSGSSTTVSAL